MTFTYEEFKNIDMRVGTIVAVENFPESIKPSYKIVIDFGPEIGLRKSFARVAEHYTKEMLMGIQVVAVINLPAKQVATLESDVLTLGSCDAAQHTILLMPSKPVPNGSRIE